MSDKRQKNQLELAFTEEGRSEAPKTSQEGAVRHRSGFIPRVQGGYHGSATASSAEAGWWIGGGR
jgi:hypothetical protein